MKKEKKCQRRLSQQDIVMILQALERTGRKIKKAMKSLECHADKYFSSIEDFGRLLKR